WPVFDTEQLRRSAGRLFGSVLSLPQNFKLPAKQRKQDFAAVYAGIIEYSDLADHCDFEGMWGRRGARVARKMNLLAIRVCTHVYILLRTTSTRSLRMIALLRELEGVAKTLQAKGERLDSADLRSEEHTSELQSRENLVCR